MTHAVDGTASAQIQRAVQLLRAGALVAFPTETVYGLGADACSEVAVRAIFAAKGRPLDHPVIVHVLDASALDRWAHDIPPAARALARAFWPGPLTLILPRSALAGDWITGGQNTVGLRSPAHAVARALLAAFGGELAAPSANLYGRISATRAQHVREDLGSAVAMVLDGGASPLGIESTIVGFVDGRPQVLRPGSIGETQIIAIAGPLAHAASRDLDVPRVPGSTARHYAPRTTTTLVAHAALPARLTELAKAGQRVGVLARTAMPSDVPGMPGLLWIDAGEHVADYARALYAALRELDQSGLDRIVVEAVPETLEWAAVRDRLSRAVTP